MANITFNSYTPDAIEDANVINVTLGVFFDGTGNNKTNIEERKKNSADFQKNGKKDTSSSYYSDWTNVARLWDNYNKKSSIYIEGIGTEDKKSDSKIGYGTGTGSTGIRGKVRKGCEEIVTKKLKPLITGKTKIGVLSFDVFGFSRGAAAARNFVYEIGKAKYNATPKSAGRSGAVYYTDSDGYLTNELQLPKRGHLGLKLKEAGIEVDVIRVRFLGIYDTVSSYGINFNNDIAELNLNTISLAKNVVHFVAENEHRENFDLTHVHIGIEKSFPGVHSDIGGSYNSETEIVKEIETDWTNRNDLEPLRKRLIAEGWYNDDQLVYTGGNLYWALQGTRYLSKNYTYIPLHFMAQYAKKSELPVDIDQIENTKYLVSNDALLTRVKKRLDTYVMGNGNPYTFKWFSDITNKYKGVETSQNYHNEINEQKDLRELRNKYLHWSAKREGIGLDPRSDRKRVTH